MYARIVQCTMYSVLESHEEVSLYIRSSMSIVNYGLPTPDACYEALFKGCTFCFNISLEIMTTHEFGKAVLCDKRSTIEVNESAGQWSHRKLTVS